MAIDKAAQYGLTAAAPREMAGNAGNTMVAATSSREIQRVQAQFLAARMFPRDSSVAMARILDACQRPGLAEKAEYSYKRGKTEDGKENFVTGASIKLAEVMAQNWGNIDFGINELENSDGRSKVEAYCVDLETNTSRRVTYEVPHIRVTRTGSYKLTDPRDIYEMIANRGARLVRGCILGIIPGDVQEAALAECKATMRKQTENEAKKGKDAFEAAIKKMIAAFVKLNITQEQLEQLLGKPANAWNAFDLETLRPIGTAIKDGEAKIEDYLNGNEGEGTEASPLISEEHRQELMSLAATDPKKVQAIFQKHGLGPIRELAESDYEEAKKLILEAIS